MVLPNDPSQDPQERKKLTIEEKLDLVAENQRFIIDRLGDLGSHVNESNERLVGLHMGLTIALVDKGIATDEEMNKYFDAGKEAARLRFEKMKKASMDDIASQLQTGKDRSKDEE